VNGTINDKAIKGAYSYDHEHPCA